MRFQGIRHAALLSAAGIALTAGSAAAQAQQQSAAAEVEEVVVTGTLIRGVAPVGSNVVSISRQDIEATGAQDTNALLATLPQNQYFNYLPQPGGTSTGGFNNRVPLARINLRNLPGVTSSSGSLTLILVDGYRLVPAGIEQTAVDVGIVPPGILERAETILDGASAIYGSDAVGGVLNFITRKRYDGTQADVRYGFADSYYAIDANVTSGKAWETGGISFSYSFAKNSELRNRNRDYVFAIDYFTGIPIGRTCNPGNVLVSNVSYTLPTLARGENSCDTSKDGIRQPSQERHSGYVVFTQDIAETIKFDMSAFYSGRETLSQQGPYRATVAINTRNPYYRQVPGTSATASQTVQFSYEPILGDETREHLTSIEMGQVTPSLTVELGDWQVRGLFSYGKSHTIYNNPTINTTIQSNYITGPAGSTAAIPITSAINPYDVTLTQNRALFGDLTYYDRGDGIMTLTNFRAIADGPLFALPGGDLRAAVGAEYYKTNMKLRRTDGGLRLLQPYSSADQTVKAVFGELNIPVVGPDNSRPGIESLTLSASGRYDDYQEFGGTFNPKFSATYEPLDWVSLRASWGKSFNAPTVSDNMGAINTILRVLTPTVPTGTVLPPGANATLFLQGSAPNLSPQKSKNWSIGGDIRPPIVPNLLLSMSYFKIDFTNIIGIPGSRGTQAALIDYPERNIMCTPVDCTPAQISAFLAQAVGGQASYDSVIGSGQRVLNLLDGRSRNLGDQYVAGLDWTVSYNYPTNFGSLDAKWAGTYQLKSQGVPKAGAAVRDDLATGTPRMRFTMTVGATVGDFRAQATLQHTSGYLLPADTTRVPDQTTVDQHDELNLFFRYNVNGTHPLTQDLSLNLTVNNVFDTNPPVLRSRGDSVASHVRTLGRVVQFGVSKKF